MNTITRTTHACTLETLDGDLTAALRAHGTEYGLGDIESDILRCCQTTSVLQKKGLFDGIRTARSAV